MAWVFDHYTPLTKLVLFLAGLSLLVWEATVRVGPTRWEFLAVYCYMMGLPAFIGADNARAAARLDTAEEAT